MPLVWILRRRGHVRTEKVTGIEYIPLVASAGRRRAGAALLLRGRARGRGAGRLDGSSGWFPGCRSSGRSRRRTCPSRPGRPKTSRRSSGERSLTSCGWAWALPSRSCGWQGCRGQLDVPMMIGVGAGIDYLAEAKPAAPTLLRHVGLEWAFRLAVEPRRLWRRYLFGNASFVWLLARERFGSGSPGPDARSAERRLGGRADEGRHPRRRTRNASDRRDRDPTQADGRDRRQADPVAHHAPLPAARVQPLRASRSGTRANTSSDTWSTTRTYNESNLTVDMHNGDVKTTSTDDAALRVVDGRPHRDGDQGGDGRADQAHRPVPRRRDVHADLR